MQFDQLRMEDHRVEGQPERFEALKAFAELRVGVQVAGMAGQWAGNLRLEHGTGPRAEPQVGVADDRRADGRLPVPTALAHRGHAVGELDLADRLQLHRATLAVHRVALDVHRGHDVVAGVGDVGGVLLDEVARPPRPRPQTVVRIDDAALGLEGLLDAQSEPVASWITEEP